MQTRLRKVARAVAGSGRAAREAADKLTPGLKPVDYVFVTQYFVRGGAEKVILNYIRALSELDEKLRFAIVTTDATPAEVWTSELPLRTELINGSSVVEDLRNSYRRRVLDAILARLKPRTIHIVNSGVGYLWARDHATELRQAGTRVVASLFNSDYSRRGKRRSFYHKYLPAAAGVVERVFTDNAAVIDEIGRAHV
jgi:hypothetical protein